MKFDFISGLNPSQKKAVLHNDGPLLVLAGAGSGKTRVLTNRIARLVGEKRCKPEQVLAVTFTNKAAAEMKQRIISMVGARAAGAMTIATFHGFGARILREHGGRIGIKPHFTILDQHQQLATIKALMRGVGKASKGQDHESILYTISRAKNNGVHSDQYQESENAQLLTGRIYTGYETMLLKRQCLDFDDLLLLPLKIFKTNSEVLGQYCQKYHFISIDEFQDTNRVQMQLAQLLAAPRNNIMAVGDDDQAIYAWRGATVDNIINFPVSFDKCTTIVLEKNYRSTPPILAGALGVIAHNRKRTIKQISAAGRGDDPILVFKADDETEEADWIAQMIIDHSKNGQFDFCDHALLVRTNIMMRRFEESLRAKGVPYRIVGAMSFFDRKEVRDVLAYIRFFANQSDELSLVRILKVPDKGLRGAAMEALDELASLRKMSLWDALMRHGDATGITPAQHGRLQDFLMLCQRYAGLYAQGNLSQTTRALLTDCGYFDLLAQQEKSDPATAYCKENVVELLRGMETYEHFHKQRQPSLAGYLQELSLAAADNDEDEKPRLKNRLTIMTLHKAKGLEFPVIFMPGLDNDIFPSPRSVEEGLIEEERRLFYVGMTRARKRLVLSFAGSKIFRNKSLPVKPCMFLNEIPPECLDSPVIGAKQNEEYQAAMDDFVKQMKEKLSGAAALPDVNQARPASPVVEKARETLRRS
ncbi:MAG: UvrD-helicase domain-containing protein [Chitinivibrionales bacterium]|nr:UvrD-helicase domain-containing protein [Chitinivibrionales bacterium]